MRRKNDSESFQAGAFTLLEILVAIGIVGLIAAIVVPSYETFKERARKAKCMSHMRAIHGGLLGYMTDQGQWPQFPEELVKPGIEEEDIFRFWVTATEPYGVGQDSWVCPSDAALVRKLNQGRQEYFGSYGVTQFDDNVRTPFRWNQPWAMESANFHGGGAHVLLPDGSVQTTDNPFFGR